ncbi:hypothetical protein [Streptomyces chartreusis]|uniref:hypothetical protein n=1 Tax=Streptomyces chartreusis TaxID=1969 RepID=UPI0033B1CCBE
MDSSLTSPLIGATGSIGAAATGASTWIIITLAAMALLPLLLKEWRTWQVDRHNRTRDRWTEDRILRTEAERRELHRCIAEEIGRLPDGPDRVELRLRLLDRTQLQIPPESPPQPGEGPANSP